MASTDDLVKRLRELARIVPNSIGNEAADRIEAIERDLAQMRRNCDGETDAKALAESNLADAESELSTLRERMKKVDDLACNVDRRSLASCCIALDAIIAALASTPAKDGE